MNDFERHLPSALAEAAERLPGLDRLDTETAARRIMTAGRRVRRRRRLAGVTGLVALAVALAMSLPDGAMTRTAPQPADTPSSEPSAPSGDWSASLPEQQGPPLVLVSAERPYRIWYDGRTVPAPDGVSRLSGTRTTPHGAVMVAVVDAELPTETNALLLLPPGKNVRTLHAPAGQQFLTLSALSQDGRLAYFTQLSRTATSPGDQRYGVVDLVTGTVDLHQAPVLTPSDGQVWGPAGLVSVSIRQAPVGVTVWRPDGTRRFAPITPVEPPATDGQPVIAEDGTAVLVPTTDGAEAVRSEAGQLCFGVLELAGMTTSRALVCRPSWQRTEDLAIGPGGRWLLDGSTPIEIATGRRGAAMVPGTVRLADRWTWVDATHATTRLEAGGTVLCTFTDSRCARVVYTDPPPFG
ncbi:MAG: hypothetical protein JNL54_14430 [Kineosporiaceae bacterium]|nr:hypothetical protein [Kineosporiaceae bacterium]